MDHHLYYGEPAGLIDTARLRRLAVEEVITSPLIRAAAAGSLLAALALHNKFWAFVWAFEKAIDRQTLPRRPLIEKFGNKLVASVFVGTARHVKQMANEEGVHSLHWAEDAQNLGLTLEIPGVQDYDKVVSSAIAGVRELIESAHTDDLPAFFSVLAGTEFIAEELSRYLGASPDYQRLFERGHWQWGRVHLATHEGPSHLDIDLDLARAYCDSAEAAVAKTRIEAAVEATIRLFGKAARDVYDSEFPGTRIQATQ